MTDETKKIFDAPWKATQIKRIEWGVRIKDGGLLLCSFCEEENANRIARLPELYDALMVAAAGECWSCAGENTETMLDHPCPKGHDEDCYVAKWRELLQKVRDGK